MDVAVVTGAGRGLGRELATRLARRGLAVLVTDVDSAAAERTAEALGTGAWAAALDVRDAEACRRVAAQAAERGRLAVWVNNAGVLRIGRAWDQPDEALELMVETNLMGVVHGSRAAVDVMRGAGGGRILNIASLSSLGPAPGLAVYGATKHAVLAFSISLEGELREARIPVDVRSICPDTIVTDMATDHVTNPDAALQWSGARVLEAGEVADRAIEALYGKPLVAVVPRWRGALGRSMYAMPRVSARLLPLFKRIGDRNRRRWLESR